MLPGLLMFPPSCSLAFGAGLPFSSPPWTKPFASAFASVPPDLATGDAVLSLPSECFASTLFTYSLISSVADFGADSFDSTAGATSVSYTHLTLPTNREV